MTLRDYAKAYPDLRTDGKVLMCSLCTCSISHGTLFQVKQHLQTTKHQELKARVGDRALRQTQLFENQPSKGYDVDLTNMFLCADIPLSKLRLPCVQKFLKKYTDHHVPSETHVRDTCVPTIFEDLLVEIREHVKNKFLWISIDETVDSSKRCVVNVVIGVMEEGGKRFLIKTEMYTTVDHKVIARLFSDSLDYLGPGFDKDKVLLFLTDAAPYMVAAANVLCQIYDKLVHVTCVVHGLHRVCEQIRIEYSNVNSLISNVKKVFVKAPNRIRIFRSLEPGLQLPPEPITTRWGTWLSAALYYAKNLDKIKGVVNQFDDKESIAIKESKSNLADKGVPVALKDICDNFTFLAQTMNDLQSSSMPLLSAMEIVLKAKQIFQSLSGTKLGRISKKWEDVFHKNKGLQKMILINLAIVADELFENYTQEEMDAFKWAILNSADVERTFSMYKHFYRDNRTKFSEENLIKMFLIYCNRNI